MGPDVNGYRDTNDWFDSNTRRTASEQGAQIRLHSHAPTTEFGLGPDGQGLSQQTINLSRMTLRRLSLPTLCPDFLNGFRAGWITVIDYESRGRGFKSRRAIARSSVWESACRKAFRIRYMPESFKAGRFVNRQ